MPSSTCSPLQSELSSQTLGTSNIRSPLGFVVRLLRQFCMQEACSYPGKEEDKFDALDSQLDYSQRDAIAAFVLFIRLFQGAAEFWEWFAATPLFQNITLWERYTRLRYGVTCWKAWLNENFIKLSDGWRPRLPHQHQSCRSSLMEVGCSFLTRYIVSIHVLTPTTKAAVADGPRRQCFLSIAAGSFVFVADKKPPREIHSIKALTADLKMNLAPRLVDRSWWIE